MQNRSNNDLITVVSFMADGKPVTTTSFTCLSLLKLFNNYFMTSTSRYLNSDKNLGCKQVVDVIQMKGFLLVGGHEQKGC